MLKHASPTLVAAEPKPRPRKTVPSSNAMIPAVLFPMICGAGNRDLNDRQWEKRAHSLEFFALIRAGKAISLVYACD